MHIHTLSRELEMVLSMADVAYVQRSQVHSLADLQYYAIDLSLKLTPLIL